MYLYSISIDLYKGEAPQTGDINIFVSTVVLELSFKIILAVVQFIRVQIFNPLSTNLLFWTYQVNIPHIFGFGPQTETLQS